MNPISFFLKKQFEIEDKIQHLLKDIQDMVLRHQNAFEAYLEDDWDRFEASQKELIRLEKELDQVGHQIQMSLLREALMPDSRDDLLNLLTKLDEIPSKLKHQLADMGLEKPSLDFPSWDLWMHRERLWEERSFSRDEICSNFLKKKCERSVETSWQWFSRIR